MSAVLHEPLMSDRRVCRTAARRQSWGRACCCLYRYKRGRDRPEASKESAMRAAKPDAHGHRPQKRDSKANLVASRRIHVGWGRLGPKASPAAVH